MSTNSSPPLTPERRKQLIRLLIIAAAIDIALKVFEAPFLVFTFFQAITAEELLEQFISTWLARGKLNLTVLDRVLGFIPIPGITPVTVRVIRELWLNRQ